MPRKYLIALLFICSLRGFAESAERLKSGIGGISGTVMDVNGAIIPEATVVLRCGNSGTGLELPSRVMPVH